MTINVDININRLQKLADLIDGLPPISENDRIQHEPDPDSTTKEGLPASFSMAVIDGRYFRGRGCGTVCCMAGWAARMSGEPGPPMVVARNYLGLTSDQADALFTPMGYRIGDTVGERKVVAEFWRGIQTTDASGVLRQLAREAEVSACISQERIDKIWAERMEASN